VTKTVIVIPAFNEAQRLDVAAFEQFFKSLPLEGSISLLFVDDGSSDGTLSILQQLVERYPAFCQAMRLDQNVGKAEAVRSGMVKAINDGAEFVGFLDADLATPLGALLDLISTLQDNPDTLMIMGSRVKLLGRDISRKAHRHYLGRVFATFVSLALRLPVYDTQCGAKVFRITPDMRQIFAKPFNSRWIFDVEILARMQQVFTNLERRVIEFPLNQWRDIQGSKVRPRDFLRASVELVAIWARYRF